MKSWKNFKRISIVVAFIYAMWLGAHVDATTTDAIAAFVIIILAGTLSVSMHEHNTQERGE